MNRIYQGHVSSVEFPEPGPKNERVPLDSERTLVKLEGTMPPAHDLP